jgi:GNAT superfamily N-acetyltransferase
MQWHHNGYSLDDDRTRLNMPRIVEWVQNSYWARGRPEAIVRGSWNNSAVVIGVYHGDEQVGCARVVTDLATIAYLADVYLDPTHRGQGLGLAMVQSLVSHSELLGLRWLLFTSDAHDLYAKAGFHPASDRVMERQKTT